MIKIGLLQRIHRRGIIYNGKEENIIKIRSQWYLFCLLVAAFLLLLISGCSSAEPTWKVYEGAAVEKSFPVPKEASKTETAPSNAKMDYVRYSVPGLKENSTLPAAYEKEIEAWGWTENKEAQTQSTRVFIKNNQVVQLSLQKNSFTIYVPKTEKAAVRGLKNSP
ncbi:hypothetical protein [Paenibacillus caui]|uniref:hypothetical protein n=1 Tax=Paenibacillus caui TaxID=2873927 RepID=UPI001F191460|nr:hypothetical protein [Paenibacillus caui]